MCLVHVLLHGNSKINIFIIHLLWTIQCVNIGKLKQFKQEFVYIRDYFTLSKIAKML